MSTDASPLPLRSSPETDTDRAVRSIEDAAAILDALGTATARRVLSTLYDEPGTASDVADAADTSLQNASYHLDRLREIGLVEVVDTWYSPKGREMDVYAPADDPLVLVAGERDDRTRVADAVDREIEAPASDATEG